MLIDVVSDLHLEIGPAPKLPGGDLLLLCGDTIVAWEFDKRAAEFFVGQVAKKYARALVLMGNHEHYHGVIDDTPTLMRKILTTYAPNAKLLDDQVEVIEGITFIGSTLWAPCRSDNPFSELRISTGMNDFRKIATIKSGDKTRRLTTADVRRRHEASVAWLTETIPQHDRVVVMTHHAPSLQSNTKYQTAIGGDLLTPAYCSDQEALILANPQIGHWFHGHTHQASSYMIGTTKVFSNQRGYYGHEALARDFDPLRGRFDVYARPS